MEHKVFVYGTLLKGELNERWAGNAPRENAWVCGTLYDTGFGFPTFVNRGTMRVAGEILRVDDEGLRQLDILEGYPRLYNRITICATLDDGAQTDALVYTMHKLPQTTRIIPSGDWRHRGYSGR